jgi:acetylglutamate kinase
MQRRTPILIKFGGELLEEPRRLRRLAKALVAAETGGPIVVVHGGGREVDAEMARLGIAKRAVDGLRLTDAATLDVVVGVLAGRVNTRLVAAIGAAGGRPVGLTGADAGITRIRRAKRYRRSDGSSVDLGFVGVPEGNETPTLIGDLLRSGYMPVVASIGCDTTGHLFNVNADTLAGDLAPRVGAKRMVIAGTTPGVLDQAGRTIPLIDNEGLLRLIREGQASAGMVAKLLACQAAHVRGVTKIEIVDGRQTTFLNSEQHLSITRISN